ncbi:MAG: glycosyltransferase [Spartobacteria bacterium]|nr:glycosyltransferase [Spartobacteria bacterium]
MDVSIVAPVYNEEECVGLLCDRLNNCLSIMNFSYEIILIDDGSKDRSWELMKEKALTIPHLKLIRLRRNFGQTAAMSAGFHHAAGDVIITMDADLQNDPNDIPRLLEKMTDDIDVVSGWRRHRKDKMVTRRLPSMMANRLISYITGVALHDYGCTLKAYRRDVIKNVHLYGEMHRFIPALASWVGGNVTEIEVTHHPRTLGTSKYGLGRTWRVILDLITVKFLLRYSTGPMQMFGKIGGIFLIPGVLMLATMISLHLSFLLFGTQWGAELIKRPFWIMSSFMLVLMGIQFICIGLLAELQTRTYHEAQDKPVYVVRETVTSS